MIKGRHERHLTMLRFSADVPQNVRSVIGLCGSEVDVRGIEEQAAALEAFNPTVLWPMGKLA
jgi:hypothetical protein